MGLHFTFRRTRHSRAHPNAKTNMRVALCCLVAVLLAFVSVSGKPATYLVETADAPRKKGWGGRRLHRRRVSRRRRISARRRGGGGRGLRAGSVQARRLRSVQERGLRSVQGQGLRP